jgi:hypothetical protein
MHRKKAAKGMCSVEIEEGSFGPLSAALRMTNFSLLARDDFGWSVAIRRRSITQLRLGEAFEA